jgi:hypothetical protein
VLRLIEPIFDQAGGGDVAMFVAQGMGIPHAASWRLSSSSGTLAASFNPRHIH